MSPVFFARYRTRVSMRPLLLALALFAAAIAPAGCSSQDDASPLTLAVGLSHVCDGRFEYFNEMLAVNTRIALARHSDNGIIETKRGKVRVQLVSMAVSGKTGSPRDVFFETVNNYNTTAILGNACSVTASGMAGAADELKVPFLVPVAAAPSVIEDRAFVFGTSPSMMAKARAFASFVDHDLGARRVAILARNGSLQLDIYAEVFADYFAGRQDGPVAVEAYDNPSEIPARLASLAALQPDVIVYCPVAPHVFTIGKELERLGARIPLVTTQSKMLFDYAKHLPQPDMPMYSLSFWNPETDGGESRAYVDAFEAVTGHLPGEDDVYVYDTALRLINAIRKADDASPESIRLALASQDALAGAAGDYTFSPDAMLRRIWRLSLKDGRLDIGPPLAEQSYASAPAP